MDDSTTSRYLYLKRMDYYLFFEDDMFFFPNEGTVCRNGFSRYTPNLYSKSLEIIKKLVLAGANVRAYDPVALNEAKHHFGDTITYCEDQYETLINADCLAVLTEWSEFRIPNFNIMYKLLVVFWCLLHLCPR